jgi:hypothetical protein
MTDTDTGLNTPAEQAEILSKPVRLDGKGEDPAIQALVDPSFVDMPDLQAAEIGAALRDLVRGVSDIRAIQQKQDEDLRKMRQWMGERDEAAKRYEEDPVKFAMDLNDKADNLRVSGLAKDKIQAKASIDIVNYAKEAKAKADMSAAIELQNFKDRVAKAPQVTVYSSGKTQRLRVGDSFINKPIAETIDVAVGKKTFRWTLNPGKPALVPDFIAQEYYARKNMDAKRDEIKEALMIGENGTMHNYADVAAKFPELDTNRRADNIIEMGLNQ